MTVPAVSAWRVNYALGLRATVAPAAFYVPLGFLLGSSGANILSPAVLDHLDVVLWLTLATLGVFAGLGFDPRTHRDRALLWAASIESLITAGVVAGVMGWLLHRWGLTATNPIASVPVILGVCAAASAATAWRPQDTINHRTLRIADLDDAVIVVLSALVLTADGGASAAARGFAVTVMIGLIIAAAGWLLFERADNDAERGVFVLGVLLLLAGTAAYLLLSPLLIGMVAGMCWRWAPGSADQIIQADLEKLQHPLIALLLVLAGATLHWNRAALWLFVPFVIFRLAGKVVAGWAVARVCSWIAPADLGARLLPCGLMGIAVAVHFNQLAQQPIGSAVVAAVAAAAIVFELTTPFALGGRDDDGP